MTRDHDKTSGNWASAQMPRLVQGQILGDAPASPAQKQREAEALRAAVEAHLANGGQILVISTPTAPPRRGRA